MLFAHFCSVQIAMTLSCVIFFELVQPVCNNHSGCGSTCTRNYTGHQIKRKRLNLSRTWSRTVRVFCFFSLFGPAVITRKLYKCSVQERQERYRLAANIKVACLQIRIDTCIGHQKPVKSSQIFQNYLVSSMTFTHFCNHAKIMQVFRAAKASARTECCKNRLRHQ